MPLYVGCASGLAYSIKLVASAMLGRQLYQGFQPFIYFTLTMALLYAMACVGATAPFLTSLAFEYAPQACQFASDPGCMSTYIGIFGSGNYMHGELQSTFKILPVAAAVASLFSVLKAGLAGCFDFAFMAKMAVAVLLCVYLP